jgi:hypothetical protein
MYHQLRRSDTGSRIFIYGMFDLFEFCFLIFFAYLFNDFAFSYRVYYWFLCNLGLIMHFMKSLMPEIWSEQESCTGKHKAPFYEIPCIVFKSLFYSSL